MVSRALTLVLLLVSVLVPTASREPGKISGYLGKSDRFDQAIADFSAAYADQADQ